MKLLTIFLFLFPVFISSQDFNFKTKNSVYAESILNSNELINISYERLFGISSNERLRIAVRLGTGFGFAITGKDESTVRFNLPAEVLLIYGEQHNIEFGTGLTSTFGKAFTNVLEQPNEIYRKYENLFYLRLGYRYIVDTGIIIRIAPLLKFYSVENRKPSPGVGFSLGYTW